MQFNAGRTKSSQFDVASTPWILRFCVHGFMRTLIVAYVTAASDFD
jgi:hypothetical protein